MSSGKKLDERMKRKIMEIIDLAREWDEMQDKLSSIFGTEPSPLLALCDKMLESAIGLIDDETNDDGFVSWYIFENDCGDAGLSVDTGNESREIRTVDDLVWAIESAT